MADQYKNTIETWKKLASVYHEKFKDLKIYDESYEVFISHLNSETPSILEIGCGPGTVTNWLKNRLPKSKIIATDVAVEMIEFAKSKISGVNFQILDARNLNTVEGTFDGLLCGFCIPYLTITDTQQFIQAASRKLKPNGVIYISFIDDDYSNSHVQTGSTGDSMKVHFYRETDIATLFAESEILPLQTFRVPYPLPDGTEQIHTILIGQKK